MVNLETDKLSTNDVIVTVYKESSKVRLSQPQNGKIRPTQSNTRRQCGYDRRAELLAHVHELRNVDTPQVYKHPSPIGQATKPKKKRRFLATLKKFRLSFSRIFGESKKRWRYESIETEEHEKRYRLCRPRNCSWNKFSKRFCRVLRQFSGFWKCNKFSKSE